MGRHLIECFRLGNELMDTLDVALGFGSLQAILLPSQFTLLFVFMYFETQRFFDSFSNFQIILHAFLFNKNQRGHCQFIMLAKIHIKNPYFHQFYINLMTLSRYFIALFLS
jgi:hypothetical protein